ncbi:MAG: 3'-5' exonuclease [Rhodobacteraceae bacterium]|nr:3'-5' exonuclease [Paracoccaceae bacterium]
MTDKKLIANWQDLLGRSDVLILDTETTGFSKQSEVIQVSMIDTLGHTRFDQYVLPKYRIPEDSTKIHGLTETKLKQFKAQPWNQYNDIFSQLTSQASIVLVYNLQYDARLIRQSCEIRGVEFVKFDGQCIMLDYSRYRAVPNQWGNGWKWHKLADAARHEQAAVKQTRVHNALSDCQTVLSLMKKVVSNSFSSPT